MVLGKEKTRLDVCKDCPHRGKLRASYSFDQKNGTKTISVNVDQLVACFLELPRDKIAGVANRELILVGPQNMLEMEMINEWMG